MCYFIAVYNKSQPAEESVSMAAGRYFRRFGFYFIIAIIVVSLGWHFWPTTKHQREISAVSVKTISVQAKTVPLTLTLPGNVTPAKAVSIKSQIAGTIQHVHFHSGSLVKKGQLLFEIEPASFVAALKQAEANLLQDTAQLQSLKSDLSRYQSLLSKAYVSTQQYEQAQANYNAQVAKVEADKQAVEQAKISLNYTKILAPISGKTGNVAVKRGDLVGVNGNIPLVVINQISPIEVDFYLPQNELGKLYRYQEQHPIRVNVWNEKVSHKLASGQLIFIDNKIDNTTGTLLLKADIKNSKDQLWPGQFVTVEMILTDQENALVIPADAIHSDQQGNFVYTAQNNHAVLTRINVERQNNNTAVIASGLKVGDQVIVIAPPNMINNALIKVEA
jgi:multidrug efflux system membrane fusion protein